MVIYKILRKNEFAELELAGIFRGSEVDIADGYIHFSTQAQVLETAQKHFSGEEDLMLLACETDQWADQLKWEPSRGGDLFPHLYANLSAKDIVWRACLPWDGAKHIFPNLEDQI